MSDRIPWSQRGPVSRFRRQIAGLDGKSLDDIRDHFSPSEEALPEVLPEPRIKKSKRKKPDKELRDPDDIRNLTKPVAIGFTALVAAAGVIFVGSAVLGSNGDEKRRVNAQTARELMVNDGFDPAVVEVSTLEGFGSIRLGQAACEVVGVRFRLVWDDGQMVDVKDYQLGVYRNWQLVDVYDPDNRRTNRVVNGRHEYLRFETSDELADQLGSNPCRPTAGEPWPTGLNPEQS